MKKFILSLAVVCFIIYLSYIKFYRTGKFNMFLDQYPDSSTVQMFEYYLGVVLSVLGKIDSAIFRFQRVVNNYTVERFKSASYYNIAQLYEESKNMHLAIKFYKLTAERYPKDYYGELAKKRYEYLLLLGYKE